MLILASESPRRQQLLQFIARDFVVEASEIDEFLDITKGINRAIEELAYKKAVAIFNKHPDDITIAADTVVLLKEEILGKPRDEAEAKSMLMALSDNTHYVITGVSILSREAGVNFHVITEVVFFPLSEAEIEDYIKECQPYDKAGAYAIQEKAALFVKEIHGDYYNIMGLPVSRLQKELKKIEGLRKIL